MEKYNIILNQTLYEVRKSITCSHCGYFVHLPIDAPNPKKCGSCKMEMVEKLGEEK